MRQNYKNEVRDSMEFIPVSRFPGHRMQNPKDLQQSGSGQQTVTTWNDFNAKWDGTQNFLISGECVPFAIQLPPVDRIIAEVRTDEKANIRSGLKGDRLLREDCREGFLALSVDEAMETAFSIAHFELARFDKPGGFFHGGYQAIMEPWTMALKANGFTWDRCNPLLFISGKKCSTNYHMDFSQVLACQVYGAKRFCGVTDPDRWAPQEIRCTYDPKNFSRPAELTEDDAVCYDMKSGDILWNTLLTPHWVDAGDQIAVSINISHGGLRRYGKLCQNEQELLDSRS